MKATMIPELGQFSLCAALVVAILLGVFPFLGVARRDASLAATGRSAAITLGALVAISFVCLVAAHAQSDFSVRNVFQNSNYAMPFVYKLSGTWGNHEGSMLLWALILSVYGTCVALIGKSSADFLTARALGIQGLVAAAFIAFILFTSNPFDRLIPAPADGAELNPLLQDPGLAIHPPFLYLGYVGFSVTFAYAIAGLLEGRIDSEWARVVRPWALAAWVFLTIGIALGSWWAYYELGWGGFWAWDPVENASFMPWLAGTAFLHSVRVVEKREAMKLWTVLLAILAFSLSLVGTFLVRSGILTSVHAFAVDPARGAFILVILFTVIGGSLLLFALRGGALTSDAIFDPVSREGALLVNNVFLVTACGVVFVGTFYPLFVDIVSGERLTVGPPYFNIAFLPIACAVLLILAPGAGLAWKRGDLKTAVTKLWPAAIAAAAIALVCAWAMRPGSVFAAVAAGLAAWMLAGVLYDLARRIKLLSSPPSASVRRIARLPKSYLGMTIAHVGVAIVAFGVIGAGAWREEKVMLMYPGDVVAVGGYEARLVDIKAGNGPNYDTEQARFLIEKNSKIVDSLISERRFYPVRRMQTTEAAIRTTLRGDLYLTLGEKPSGQDGWAVRAYYHPLVFWLWFGAAIVALGGAVAGGRQARSTHAQTLKHRGATTEAAV